MFLQTETISEIEIQKVLGNEFRLRPVNDKIVRELMISISANGLLHPIIVKPLRTGMFKIVIGEHRFEAAKRLEWTSIPAIVKSVSDEEGFLMNVTENLQRNTYISPIAEGRGYKRLLSKNWTVREIASKIGKSDSYVCCRLRVLDRLHPRIQRLLELPRGNSELSLSHAEHLSLVGDPERQLELAKKVAEQHLSVRQLERITRKNAIRLTPDGCLCLKCSNYACNLHELHQRVNRTGTEDARTNE